RGNARTSVDACAATRLDNVGPGLLKDFQIALSVAVFSRLLRTELNIELYGCRDFLALLQRVVEHPRVLVHVFILTGGAGAAIGKLYRHWRTQIANELAVPGIAGHGN